MLARRRLVVACGVLRVSARAPDGLRAMVTPGGYADAKRRQTVSYRSSCSGPVSGHRSSYQPVLGRTTGAGLLGSYGLHPNSFAGTILGSSGFARPLGLAARCPVVATKLPGMAATTQPSGDSLPVYLAWNWHENERQ
jgi:hypothetical protein